MRTTLHGIGSQVRLVMMVQAPSLVIERGEVATVKSVSRLGVSALYDLRLDDGTEARRIPGHALEVV